MEKEGLENGLLSAIVSVGWTHKIQEKQAEIYATRNKFWTLTQLISAGLTSTGAVTIIISNSYIVKILTVIVGLTSFISSGVLKAWNYKELSIQSKHYANNQFQLRENLLACLRNLVFDLQPIDDIKKTWHSLEQKRLSISADSPYTSNRAVNKASKQLKVRRDNIVDDDYKLFISSAILQKIFKN